MMTRAMRNSVKLPRALVSCTMAIVTVGEKDTTTVDTSALTARACGTVMAARKGRSGLSANERPEDDHERHPAHPRAQGRHLDAPPGG